ncbi:hypothetical protein LTS08_007378 [Lithohypha guttulata]|nr:hypothetical protein LTS08_007378 [Lithohypha guttulata]
MATAKPPILTVNFFRAVRSCRPQTYHSICNRPTALSWTNELHTSSQRLQHEQGYQRYGPAATLAMPPPPKPSDPYLPSTEQTKKDASDIEVKRTEHKKNREKDKEKEQRNVQKQNDVEKKAEQKEDSSSQPEDTLQATDIKSEEPAPKQDQQQQQPPPQQPPQSIDDGPLPNQELDIVLSIPSPSQVKADGASSHHPHLEASPYEHHFDTYSLVQELCKEAAPNPHDPNASPDQTFSSKQAIILMKSIRLMLAQNLDLAKEGLVSKSDTENETYLFRAACSELKTTMQTSRFMEAQKQRSQRAQLQHEYDILNQKVGNDVASMREELKGMFNDRKLGLADEKRKVDGKIQSLSYRISVDLNSDSRSEVEGLRWVLTRRAALAIGAAASMTLAFLQYYSVKSREQAEIEKKRKAAQREQEERLKREQDRFGTSTVAMGRSAGTQTDGIVLGGTAGGNYEESLG